MNRRLGWLLTFALWLCILPPCPAQTPPGSLVVVLLPGTSLSDWRRADAPTLHRLMAGGALAVMNTRTARLPNDHARETPESAALTLGAGSRAAGGPEATDFQPAERLVSPNVTAGNLFTRRTGTVPPPGDRVNVVWPRALQDNQGRGYDIRLGNLGDALWAHGITTQAQTNGLALPLACRSDGTVHASPSVRFPAPASFVVIDAGADLHRADGLLRPLAEQIATLRGRLLIVSPSVSDAEYARGERLAPLVMWGEGVAPGLVYSPSTHRAGLVTNTDFAPTVAAYFGATLPVKPFGGVWQVRPAAGAEAAVAALEAEAYQQSRAMRLLPYLAILLGIVLVLGTVLWVRGRPLTTLFVFPIALTFALIAGNSALPFHVWLILFMVSPFAVHGFDPKHVSRAMAAIVGVLLVDMCLGDPLMRRSMLGYSAVEGARYYGIGNETMGALVGAALVLAARLWRPDRRMRTGLVVFGLTATALLLGSPLAGAKFGGLVVAVASFLTLLWGLRRGTLNARSVGLALGAAALALAVVALMDLHGGQQTHAGRAVSRILGGGWGEADDIIRRKLAVEGRLLYHSAWAVPLWAGAAGMLTLRRKMAGADAQTRALWRAGWVAVGLCLAVNDAGVVAAALCASLLWSGLMALQTGKGPRREETIIAPRDAGR